MGIADVFSGGLDGSVRGDSGDNFTKMGLFDDIWGSKGLPSATLADYAQAANQSSTNSLYAAIANALLSRPNQSNPYGTRTTTQTGTQRIGNFDVPTYAVNTELSASEQPIFDMAQMARGRAASNLATDNLPQVPGATDLNAARNQVQQALFSRQMGQLQPGFDINRDRVRTDLANRGFSVQDKGYDNAWSTMVANPEANAINLAGTSAIAGGDAALDQFARLGMAERGQAFGENMATLTGATPIMPNFDQFAAGGVTGADQLGALNANQRNALTAYDLETKRAWAEHQGGMDVWKQSTGGGGPMGSFGGAK